MLLLFICVIIVAIIVYSVIKDFETITILKFFYNAILYLGIISIILELLFIGNSESEIDLIQIVYVFGTMFGMLLSWIIVKAIAEILEKLEN